jgi:RNA polymerase sigma factor (sigma-70 family)
MNAQVLDAGELKLMPGLLAGAKPPVDSVIQSLSPEDQVLLTKLLNEPSDYMDHVDLTASNAETRFFGGKAQFTNSTSTRFVEHHNAAVQALTSGDRVPTLSHSQEEHLFLRFNFARKQVADILKANSGKRLTARVTRILLGWGHRVLASRSEIVRVNMPLVLAMAKRTRLSHVDFNELVSEGNMALLRSVDKFDCARGFKFSTYSCRAILKSFSRVAMRTSRYRGKFPAEFDPSMERSDFVDRMRESTTIDCVDELKEIFLRNLAGLTDVERTVIMERFALGQAEQAVAAHPGSKTLEQVGTIIGVTKERVRQIQNNALKKMRVALEDRFLAA